MDSALNQNLVDYFFVCGLDPNIGLDPYEITNECDEASCLLDLVPLKRPYKPSILQRFPDHCGNYPFPEDYSITSLCMPDGIRLFTESSNHNYQNQTKLGSNPTNHNFIVIREDASRIYGTALIFTEEVDHEEIKLAVTDLQKMYKVDIQTGINIAGKFDELGINARDSGHFSTSGSSEFWMEDEKLYTTKAIGLLSQHAYIHCLQSWLYDLWWYVIQTSRGSNSSISRPISTVSAIEPEESSDVDLDPADIQLDLSANAVGVVGSSQAQPLINLESYLYNILFEVDPISPGKMIVLEGPNFYHYCKCAGKVTDAKELPVFELPMLGLLKILGLENLIRVYCCVLLEYRVVVVSKDYRLLMLVADCVTCLLFPFVWSHVYAPILPLAARHFLNAPLPFIMGIRIATGESPEDVIQLGSEASVCYVNVDTHSVTTPDDIPSFPYEMELRREITELLIHWGNDTNKSPTNIDSSPTGISSSQFTGRRSSVNPVLFGQMTSSTPNSKAARQVKSNKKSVISHLQEEFGNNSSVEFDDLADIRKSIDTNRRNSQLLPNDIPTNFDAKPIWMHHRLIKDAGISIQDLMEPILSLDSKKSKSEYAGKVYIDTLKFNTVLRELFLNHFLHIFYDYEQYIIPAKDQSNLNSYFTDRESAVQNFDKASFLSEQPETHLPFLSAFLETQMFANFIDMKIVTIWQDPHPNLVIFEKKLRQMRHNISRHNNLSSNNEMIGVRPYRGYFKSTSILNEAEKQFQQYNHQLNMHEPSIKPHILSCNSGAVPMHCSPSLHQRFCVSHHHHHHQNQDEESNNNKKSALSSADCSHNHNDDHDECCMFNNLVSFPVLQGDCLRNRPRKKSVPKPISSVELKSLNVNRGEHSLASYDGPINIQQIRQQNVRVKALQRASRDQPITSSVGKYNYSPQPVTTSASPTSTLTNVTDNDDEMSSINNTTTEFNNSKDRELAEKHISLWKNRARIDPKLYFTNMLPKDMAQNNWTFVTALLQETKAKTKRMVLEKMGCQEAHELGHSDVFVSDIEENTLVSGLCDLLERIWCHNIDYKQGKSALWTHLIKYYDCDQKKSVIKKPIKEMQRRGSEDSKGQIVQQGEYCGSLKKMDGHNNSKNGSTPDFLNKMLGANVSAPRTSGGETQTSGGVASLFFNWNQNHIGSLERRSLNKTKSNPGQSMETNHKTTIDDTNIDLSLIFGPARTSLVADIRAIKNMVDIRTDVGLSRAFIRLALEKKLLSEHLKRLLSNTILLKELYKRHAFLRCEEEREQFLFHLLALQAVEYYSFTNSYICCVLQYRVYINCGRRFSKGCNTTANVWFSINGQLSNTSDRQIPKDCYQFQFENQNLGILTTMKLWHDNTGLSPKWFVKFVLVQNIITGHIYKFSCNRWFGKNVDDFSTERLLIGELLRYNEDEIKDGDFTSSKSSLRGIKTPPRSRSPSLGRKSQEDKQAAEIAMIQEQLGNAVNSLVKFFCRLQDRAKLSSASASVSTNLGKSSVYAGSCSTTILLCGEYGLVNSMMKVFLYGFKSSWIFQKKSFVWDYLEKAAEELQSDLHCSTIHPEECLDSQQHQSVCNNESCIDTRIRFSGTKPMSITKFCNLVKRISTSNDSIGKDGKFQKLVCIAIRDHSFADWIEIFGLIDTTQQYYDENSFFRQPHLREFLIKILKSLNEFHILLEPALID